MTIASTTAAPADFRDLAALVRAHADARPTAPAVVCGDEGMDYRRFDARADRIAASLQRDGLQPRDTIAICAPSSIDYLALFIGALRAGVAVAPLAPSSTAAQLVAMVGDADARLFFVDAAVADSLAAAGATLPPGARSVRLDDSAGDLRFGDWLAPAGTAPAPVAIDPDWAFNLIYSSGTTGTPKGIVQPHAMRWAHIQRAAMSGYGPDTVTLTATPLYSNTTLVSVIPTLAYGGCVVLMPKFEAGQYLALAERHRATHTMLVPVQYQRLMARPDFDRFDLSAFRFKFCTSAPFHAELKADVLARWPGALVEYYGMTEGGGTCILQAHLHPDKLHTVGQPAEGHDIRLIDEDGREVPPGESGEVVGRSPGMMSGYHKQPAKTAEAEWFDAEGRRYIRTGDVGRFDADGFLVLHDRRKDMIISGGFNIYPSDLEAVLRRHPAVADAAVIGIPSAEWGETPVACVVLRAPADADAIRQWVNDQVGKTQRLAAVRVLDELPRSAIGKVLKRDLRERFAK
ncbi:class I adenylate-forming enzyme family protein [Aquabacterium humicola]|uniref:class I adenylate-forming enzyme family protein n=1 Tax=Aquabacterium humicola TaxID=3237377 RepID=UPI0025436D2A|nr:class I adenylate-forming enzyme family protein [Rubrivivax pictus]